MRLIGAFSIIILIFLRNVTFAQTESENLYKSGFVFSEITENPVTSVKNQNKSSTCWAFSSLSFLESEILRKGGPEVDLSEMYLVWHCYSEKAQKYVRMHGNLNFGPGGAFHDVMWVIKNFGIVPEEVYSGLNIGEDLPIHGEMDEVLKSYVNGIIKNPNKKLSPVWYDTFKDMLSNYLGPMPEKFAYNGVAYTPKSFVKEYLKINPDDYVEIGSYSHHPFYEKFILEVPDNWLWDEIYNVPINEMLEIMEYAVTNGYTIAWGADVSDKGFATKTKGVAVVPDEGINDMTETDLMKWQGMSKEEKEGELFKLDNPGKEKIITQEIRQIDFDNYSSTDDHGMHIIGIVKDQNGTKYFKVKNSWGEYNSFDGYFYASMPYVALRTIDFLVHKEAIPQKIRLKLGL